MHQVGDLFELNVKLRCQKVKTYRQACPCSVCYHPQSRNTFHSLHDVLEQKAYDADSKRLYYSSQRCKRADCSMYVLWYVIQHNAAVSQHHTYQLYKLIMLRTSVRNSCRVTPHHDGKQCPYSRKKDYESRKREKS